MLTSFLTPGILFLLILAFGLWLRKKGRPYPGLLFNIHKLLALGTVILTALELRKLLTPLELTLSLFIFLLLATLSVVALFFSGAMMSAGQLKHVTMQGIHSLAPILLLFSIGMTLYALWPLVH